MAKVSTKTDAEKAADAAAKLATFKKLAGSRLANAKGQIALLGNLGSYKPSEAAQTFLVEELGKAVMEMAARLKGNVKASTDIAIPD